MSLYQTSVLKSYINLQEDAVIEKAYKKYVKYFLNPTIQENIRSSKEEEYQGIFLTELFVNILDYTLKPKANFNLVAEYKNQTNSRKADGAILHNNIALGVIELKGTKTKDLESIRKQAFDYKANQKGCVYVITSNFEKLRFYINDATEFEEFNLFELTAARFQLFYLCLQKDNILNNVPLQIKEASIVQEEQITKDFYKDYSLFKRELYRDLVKNNKNITILTRDLSPLPSPLLHQEKITKLTLFKKSQKLIDRFLFIFFAEDRSLLPANSTELILQKWKADIDFGDDRPLYNLFKQYFHFLDKGRQGTKSRGEIYAYNGGLFKEDTLLDNLEIDSHLLYKHTHKLAGYDFESQVDVNILGHIFENSLNEIESVNAEIEGADFDKQKSKRKKDGVFYTPKYITKYIVENTVGKLCTEKKTELGIKEEEYFKGRKNRQKTTITKLVTLLDDYRAWLLQLTICDPACGSGAFLNQALNFLIAEHTYIDELKTKVLGGGLQFPDIENTILENNIFGVDLNEESVEIAKLSLWLRTAQPRRKLNDLSSNIKCGNSLIDSKTVAGDKAFHWETQFPNIFQEKNKKAYHITTAIHDSRTSARMKKYKVRERREMGTNPYPNVIYFTPEDDANISKTIAEIVQEDNLNLLAYNICADHIHLLLVCELEEIPAIMQKIKGRTSYNNKGHNKGLKPLVEKEKEKKNNKPLWQQKYSAPKEITSEEQLYNTVKYIQTNRAKHELPAHKKTTQQIIDAMCCTKAKAFKTEYKGGFDVVIGNPPYVRAELLTNYLNYFEKNYSVYHSASDLFAYFYELGSIIINNNGLMGYISNTFDKTTAGKVLREYLTNKTSLKEYIDFTEVQIFEGATTYPVIIILENGVGKDCNFKYIKIPKISQSRVINIDNENEIQVLQSSLNSKSWSFLSVGMSNIFNKIIQHTNLRDKYGKCYYGVKTALNDAFIINNDWAFSEHIKPILEGKEIKKWNVQKVEQRLILFKSRWTNEVYANHSSETEKLESLIKDFPEIFNHLLAFKDRAIKRYDKGDYWWELRNCAYYDLFDKPKIIFPNLQNTNKFCFDPIGTFVNAPAVFLPVNSKALLCVLNSKIVWEFLKSICVVRSGGYIEVKPQYFEQIPIPEIKNESTLEIKANIIIELVNDFQILATRFQTYLKQKFQLQKLSKKLQNWHELDFGDFIKELNKAIKANNKNYKGLKPLVEPLVKSLTKKDEFDWLDLFEENKQEAQALQTQINQIDAEIDKMVYELYGLTEEEIAIVENS